MPKKIFKRYLPDPHKIKHHPHLVMFGDSIHDPNLWHVNRYSVATACSIGLFVAFVPIPMQMVLAAAISIFLRANLLVSVILVWVSNPLTMPFLYYFAYQMGAWILQTPASTNIAFEISIDWLTHELLTIWKPFLLGCLICGLVLGVVGNFSFRVFWRWWVVRHWRQRAERRATNKT